MKLTEEKRRELVWDALYKNGGDRKAASQTLEVSERTLARYITDLSLHEDMQRLGWKRNPGPPPGMSRGSSVIRMQIIAHIKQTGGVIRSGELSKAIWGQDTVAVRNRLFAALEEIKTQGIATFDGETWRLVKALDRVVKA